MIAALLWWVSVNAVPVYVITWADTAITGANVAWCEAGREYTDGVYVLQTARNNARRLRRPLLTVLKTPGWYAYKCTRVGLTMRHITIGIQAATADMKGPDWIYHSYAYCGDYDRPGICEGRCVGGCPMVGTGRVMRYYGLN